MSSWCLFVYSVSDVYSASVTTIVYAVPRYIHVSTTPNCTLFHFLLDLMNYYKTIKRRSSTIHTPCLARSIYFLMMMSQSMTLQIVINKTITIDDTSYCYWKPIYICHNISFDVTSSRIGCHNDNLHYRQWWQSWHHTHSQFSSAQKGL